MPIRSGFGAGSIRGFSPSATRSIADGQYSNVFNGATSYLSYGTNSSYFPSGTSAWTLEMFVYITSTPTIDKTLFNIGYSVSSTLGSLDLSIEANTRKLLLKRGSGGFSNYFKSTNAIPLNQWVYLAASYGWNVTGGLKLWIDGTEEYTTTTGYSWGNAGPLQIGRFVSGGNTTNFDGKISNLRWRVGTALSTAPVPTVALTNVTNTIALTCQSSTIKDNSTANAGGPWSITNNNSVTVSPTSPFYP
jgi:hypothetical protein